MRVFILLTLMFLAATIHAQEAAQLKKADSLLKANKLTDAVALYTKIIKTNPKSDTAHRQRGYALLLQGKFSEGEKDYRRALVLDPGCGDCYAYLGISRIHQQKWDSAMAFAEKAISVQPNAVMGYIARARVFSERSQFTEAAQDFDKALALDGANTSAYYYRAFMHLKQNDYDAATKDFLSIIRIDSNDAEAYHYVGIGYANTQQLDKALRYFQMAIGKDSTGSEHYKMAGNVFYQKDHYDSAIWYYSRTLQYEPDDYDALFFRSKSKYAKEDMDGSCKDLQETLKKIGANAEGYALDLKQDAGGLASESCDSSRPGYYYHRGIANYNLDRLDLSLQFYNRGLAKFPQHAMMTSFRGNAYLAMGDNKKAIEDYTKALSLRSNFRSELDQSWSYRELDAEQKDLYSKGLATEIYTSRAEAKMKLGDEAGAAQDVEEVLNTLPENAPNRDRTYILKGVLAMNQNDNSKALTAFNKALAVNANNAVAYVNRAVVKMSLAYKTKVVNQSIQLGGRGLNGSFQLPPKEKAVVNKDNLRAALVDLNKAISLDKNYAYAYYVRGTLKYELGEGDYCYDFLMAEKLGLSGITEALVSYKCR